MRKPEDLTRDELLAVVRGVWEALWGDGPDAEWSADTIERVSVVLDEAGLGPVEP